MSIVTRDELLVTLLADPRIQNDPTTAPNLVGATERVLNIRAAKPPNKQPCRVASRRRMTAAAVAAEYAVFQFPDSGLHVNWDGSASVSGLALRSRGRAFEAFRTSV